MGAYEARRLAFLFGGAPGTAVLATAYAGTLAEALARRNVAEVLNGGALTYAFLLGGTPGTVRAVYRRQARTGEWKPETDGSV